MGILSFLKRRRSARFAAKAASEVAERSYVAVLNRVRRRAKTMRIAEARGYVRSRALEIVHRELAAVHHGHIALDPAVQTEIISRAVESVVASVLAELRGVPKTVKPNQSRAA